MVNEKVLEEFLEGLRNLINELGGCSCQKVADRPLGVVDPALQPDQIPINTDQIPINTDQIQGGVETGHQSEDSYHGITNRTKLINLAAERGIQLRNPGSSKMKTTKAFVRELYESDKNSNPETPINVTPCGPGDFNVTPCGSGDFNVTREDSNERGASAAFADSGAKTETPHDPFAVQLDKAKEISLDSVMEAAQMFVKNRSIEDLVLVLGHYGVQTIVELPAEKYKDFLEAIH